METLKNFSSQLYENNKNVIDVVYNYTINKFSNKYSFYTKNQKYDLRIIITEIIYLLKTGISYKNYRGPINAKTLNTHVLFFTKHNIFKNAYSELFNKYTNKNQYSKFKYQSTDTSFILNKNGKQIINRNKYNKNKKCYKLSIITDKNGISNSVIVEKGGKNDAKIGIQNIIHNNNKMKQINNKIKPYMLADKIYDTKEFRNVCNDANYTAIIGFNKRNTKNKKLIKQLTLQQTPKKKSLKAQFTSSKDTSEESEEGVQEQIELE